MIEEIEDLAPATGVIIEELAQDEAGAEGGERFEVRIQGVVRVDQPQDAVLALASVKGDALLSDHGFMPLLQTVDRKGHLLRLVTLNPDL
jgi:hypothetical protein